MNSEVPKFAVLEGPNPWKWYSPRGWGLLGTIFVGAGNTLTILFGQRWAYFALTLPGVMLIVVWFALKLLKRA